MDVLPYINTLHSMARRISPKREREDVFQEMCLAFIEAKTADVALVLTIAKCRAIDYLRSRRSSFSYANHVSHVWIGDNLPFFEEFLFPVETDTENKLIQRIQADDLLSQVTGNERTVLEMWMQSYKQREIANYIGVTRSRVSQIRSNALSRLRSNGKG